MSYPHEIEKSQLQNQWWKSTPLLIGQSKLVDEKYIYIIKKFGC